MSLWKSITSVLVPIHREGHAIIAVFAGVTLILMILWQPLGWIGVVLTGWCVFFFRDPDRHTPQRKGLTVSPADGVVSLVGLAPTPPELEMGEGERMRVCVFMNVFNVHVNRSPADGTIVKQVYTPGLFINADLDKASEDNERMALRLKTDTGKDIAVVQIAGLVARRIVCDVDEGDVLQAGERFGIIRFGSRLDVYLDDGMIPLVAVGQRMIAGETVIADEESSEVQRKAEIR